MFRKSILNLPALIIFLAIATSFSAQAEKLLLSAFNYPPYMDESLPDKGVFCELVSAAYDAAGYKVEFQFYPLARSTKYVIDGKVMAQLGTEWNFPEQERSSSVTSVPLFYYRVVGFYLEDKFPDISFKSLQDLLPYRLGVIRGSSDAAILNSASGLGLDLEEVSRMDHLLKMVEAGRSDIAFMVELSGLSRINKLYPDRPTQWKMSEDAIQGIPAHVVFSNNYPGVIQYINAFRKGLEQIQQNGTYQKIFEKYYGEGKVPAIVSELDRDIYIIPQSTSEQ